MSLPVPFPLPDPAFWRGKRVLVTGHTGFKGTWLTLWLQALGATVTGFARAPDQSPALFDLAGGAAACQSILGELNDAAAVDDAIARCDPQIVLHLAAQALVRRSIAAPVETIATNVLGTAVLLDALRRTSALQAILVVTSDKVYDHSGHGSQAFQEADRLGGRDPYSASKAACEIVVASMAASFFGKIPVATARGGNVIGGGDFSADRLVPDLVRAAANGGELVLRHPEATRPWQHVLDCLSGYLLYAEHLAQGRHLPSSLNIGPDHRSQFAVGDVATRMLSLLGVGKSWRLEPVPGSIEMATLSIDAGQARRLLAWTDRLPGQPCFDWTADWYRHWLRGADMQAVTAGQIERYARLDAAC